MKPSSEILLILDNLIAVGNICSIISFIKSMYALVLIHFIVVGMFFKNNVFLVSMMVMIKSLYLCAVSIF